MASTDSNLHDCNGSDSEKQKNSSYSLFPVTEKFREFGIAPLPKARLRDLEEALVASVGVGVFLGVWKARFASREPPKQGVPRGFVRNAISTIPRGAMVSGARGTLIQLVVWGIESAGGYDSDPRYWCPGSMLTGALCGVIRGPIIASINDFFVLGSGVFLFKNYLRDIEKKSGAGGS